MTIDEIVHATQQVQKSKNYEDIFGDAASGPSAETIRKVYRKLAQILHPDVVNVQPMSKKAKLEALSAFQALENFRSKADEAVRTNSYGAKVVTITSRRASHQTQRQLLKGSICEAYSCSSTINGIERSGFLKIARSSADTDLLTTEAAVIKHLRGASGSVDRMPFVSELIDSFVYKESGKKNRQANVMARLDGFYNLDQLKIAFAGKFEVVHMIWIWRRVLVALGYAHSMGVVHGAVLPEHIMVLPEQHGVVLVDWCYASRIADGVFPAIKAIVSERREWYPDEVLSKQSPSSATDIVMAARCMIELLGGNPMTGVMPDRVPKPFRAFLRSCLASSQSARPQDAFVLLGEFDELLEEIGTPYYPRRFRPLSMPSGIDS